MGTDQKQLKDLMYLGRIESTGGGTTQRTLSVLPVASYGSVALCGNENKVWHGIKFDQPWNTKGVAWYIMCNANAGTALYHNHFGWFNGSSWGFYCRDSNMYAGSYQNLSDERTKRNIRDLSSTLGNIKRLKAIAFNPRNNPDKESMGLSAQDVAKIFPEAVSTMEEGDLANPTKLLAIDYSQIVVALLKAVQELTERVEALEKK